MIIGDINVDILAENEMSNEYLTIINVNGFYTFI